MADRKYRQQGYRSPGTESGRREPPAAEAPRSGGMLARHTVSRCGACGAVLPIATATLEQCPNCRAAIRACRQCAHFDAGRRFECDEPIPARLADKSARGWADRKSTRLNSSHVAISYAVFCLKKKKKIEEM